MNHIYVNQDRDTNAQNTDITYHNHYTVVGSIPHTIAFGMHRHTTCIE